MSASEGHATTDSMIRVDKRQRRYVLLVYAWLAVFSLSLFGLLHMLEGNTLVGQLELLGAFAALLTIGGLRATNNIELVRSCLLLIIIAMLIVMLITGGTQGTGIFWCFLLPVAAFFLTGKMEGSTWMILFLAMIFLLWAISQIYNIPLYYDDITIRQLMVTLLVVSLALYVYQASREAWEMQALRSHQELQANLRHMATLHAKVDHEKSEFVTLASHQLRTPISAIGWSSEMLLSGDIGKLTKEQMEYIQGVYDSNRRLGTIVDSMLLVSSLEIGALYVRPEPTDLAVFINKLLADEVKKYPDKKLEIKQAIVAGLPKIKLDQHITKQILQNLVSNAIKYTPDGGQVMISVDRLEKKLTPQSRGSLQIVVSDTGYGIPESEQKNVFAKLFRAANIKTKDVDGTGLGLFIVKALTDVAGGQVAFESKENKGSTFTVLFPIEGMSKKERGGEDGGHRK